MLNTILNPLIQSAIDPILANKSNELVNLVAIFSNPSASFSVVVSKFISEMIITQDYIQNYCDKITLTCRFTIQEYESLRQWRKDLRCEMQWSKANMTSGALQLDNPTLKRQYRVFFITQVDPFRQAPSKALMGKVQGESTSGVNVTPGIDEQRVECKLELIPEYVYFVRKRNTHFIARNVTMETLLKYSAVQLGMTQHSIITPDNTTEYEQFIVPPSLAINELFPFFQYGSGNGVYNRGFCYYFTQQVLYVFPRFASAQRSDIIHVYSVGEKMYDGMYSNHILAEDGSTVIMANTEVSSRDYNDIGAENEGTAWMFQRSEKVFENTHSMVSDESEMNITAENFRTIYGPEPDGMVPNNVYYKYTQSHSNEYALKSTLVRMRGTEISFGWKMAVPWTFKPNRTVYFHYEKNGVFMTDTCSCEYIQYRYIPTDSKLVPLFSCTANVRINTEVK